MSFHLRYTPYELGSSITDALARYDRYIIARETRTKEGKECPLHYHCYIESDLDIDTIREYIKSALGIPKGGKGRNNKYYMLQKWHDIWYIVKQGDIVAVKGYDIGTLRVPPCHIKEEKKIPESPTATAVAEKKEKISMWGLMMEEAIYQNLKLKKKIDYEEALRCISRVYIRKTLPLPHPGDRKRWARSLVLYSELGWDTSKEDAVEKAIETEMCEYIADNMITNRP